MRSATSTLARACLSLVIGAVAFGVSPATPRESILEVRTAQASDGSFRVGDLLQALEDVELDEATIASGSKVRVSAQKKVGGRLLLDIALADGHIVRAVPLTVVRGAFRRIAG